MTHRTTFAFAALSMILAGAFAGCIGSKTETEDPATGLDPAGDLAANATAPKVETFKGNLVGGGACGVATYNLPDAKFMNDFSVPKNTTAARFEAAFKPSGPTVQEFYYRVENTEGKLIKSAKGATSPLVVDLEATDLKGLGTVRFRAWVCGASASQPFDFAVSFFQDAIPSGYTAFKA